ncbi:MAG TPA: hypothetical protein VFA81_00115 [Burkholderiales bacterium]|nr:hypothetical protein [Burkholderiales bacterium]
MSANVDLKACTIYERLIEAFEDGTVDYTCAQDLHAFRITRGSLQHEIDFSQQALEGHDVRDIEQAAGRLAEVLKASVSSRHIRIASYA